MEKIKFKVIAAAVVAMLVTFMSQNTVAYYQTVGSATNVVTSGNIKLIIHEKTDTGSDFPEEGVYVLPGDVVSKRVSVENVCEHPFYLRVKIVYGVDNEWLSSDDCFKLDINDTYWEYHNGWYYYKQVVGPGETTPNVFSRVEIVGSAVDERYGGSTLILTVEAQALQSENNPIKDGKTHTASGWPKE